MKKWGLLTLLACFFCVNAWGLTIVNIDQETNAEREAALRTALARTDDQIRINLMDDVYGYRANGSGVSGRFEIPEGADIILNLGSAKVGAEGFFLANFWDDEPEDGIRCYATILNRGRLHIITEGDGIVTGVLQSGFSGGFPIATYGELIIDGGKFACTSFMASTGVNVAATVIYGYEGSQITINGGLFDGYPDLFMGMVYTKGDLSITGGKFGQNKVNSTKTLADYFPSTEYSVKSIMNVSWSHSKDANRAGYWVAPAGTEEMSGTANTIEASETPQIEEAIFVESGAKLTVEAGATLKVNKDFALADSTSKLVIEEGARVIVGNEFVTTSTKNIELTIDDKERQYSNLLVAAGELQESHPKATVVFDTKAKYDITKGKYIWQRFAVPSYANFNYNSLVNAKGVTTAICGWDYEANGGEGAWVTLKAGDVLKPFQMYALSIYSREDTAQYQFPCELVGNGNPELEIREGWNYFANAYTAPMNLKAWLIDLMEDPELEGIVDGTVYVQQLGVTNSWYPVTYAKAKKTGNRGLTKVESELQPMQAFIYYGNVATTIPLKYKEYVYDPIANPAAVSAPHRNAFAENYQDAVIVITDSNNEEEVLYVYEGSQFSDAKDNGYDAIKLMNDEVFNAYFVTPIGNLSDLATDNLENAQITLSTYQASEFTMSFEDVTLEGYSILDNLTNTKTEINANNTYVFSGEANQVYNGRFTIVKNSGDDPTAIEDTTIKQKENGIYTLTGQYVGRDLNVLPAGVYVVNGHKVVR